jgi:hypothetical protein
MNGFICRTAHEATEYPGNYHGHEERNACYIGIQIPMRALQLLTSEEVAEFHTVGACSCLFLTGVKNNINNSHSTNTYLLTPWSRFLLDKLTGLQLVKKFPAFYGTRKFITALTSARQLSLS